MKSMNIVLVGPMPAVGKNLLQNHLQTESEITVMPDPSSAADHLEVFETADVIVGGPITEAIAKRASRLKLFHVFRGGIDGLGITWLPESVLVANTYHHGVGVAEFALAAMLVLPRQICFYDQQLRRGVWQNSRKMWGELPNQEALTGKTAMIVGLGHIGTEVALRARAFGVHLIAVSRTPDRPSPHVDSVVGYDAWRDHLPQADFVIASCRLAPNTEGLFGVEEFAEMRPSAYFVNVARAQVADERALYEALRDKMIAGAAIDTWYQYPERPDEVSFPSQFPIHELPNVLMSPNRASWTQQLLEGRVRDVADNINRLASEKPLINVVPKREVGRLQHDS